MNDMPPLDHEELIRRITRDIADSYDEEIEMEIEDRHPLPDAAGQSNGQFNGQSNDESERDYRAHYFSQLFRLQSELVKLPSSGDTYWLTEHISTGSKAGMSHEVTRR